MELTEREQNKLRRVRERRPALLVLNCETFELVIDQLWQEKAGGQGVYLHVRGIDGRVYHGCMLPHDVERLRDVLNGREP
jgi:hypothetical protein